MKKNFFASFLVFILGLVFASCTTQQQAQPTPIATQTAQAVFQTPTSAPTETTQPTKTPSKALTVADVCDTNPVPPELLASSPQVKSDKLIAFSTEYHNDISGGYADVYLVRFDGTGLKQLTYNPGDDGSPTWTPDGKKILFSSDRNHPVCGENDFGCGFELFIVKPDGTGSRKLTPDSPYYPGRSPDGKFIAKEKEFYDPDRLIDGLGDYLSDIIITDMRGSSKNITAQFQPAGFGPIEWSTTGKQFAFSGITEPFVYLGKQYYSDGYWPRNIYLVNADGSGLQKLPGGPFAGRASYDAWSPDGQQLAFLTAKGIATIKADGSEFVEFPIEKSAGGRDIFWLDDNSSLIFTDAAGDYYKINPDFTGLQRLPLENAIDKLIYRFHLLKTHFLYEQTLYGYWLSPNGKWIAYIPCGGQIRVINTQTHQSFLVFQEEQLNDIPKDIYFKDTEPWGFGGNLEWTSDSRQLLFTYRMHYMTLVPTAIFVVNLDGTGLRQISVDNEFVCCIAIQP